MGGVTCSWESVCIPWQDRWFRSFRTNGFSGLSGYRNYIGNCLIQQSMSLRIDSDAIALIYLPKWSEEPIRLVALDHMKAELVDELVALQTLQNFQWDLPFLLEACR